MEVGGGFFHMEMRLVTETYTEQEPYMTTESYSCGTGTNFQMCSRTVTRYRTVTKTRTVMRNVEVSDGWCARSLDVSPKVGHMYIVDFTYRESRVCSVTCLEQVAILSDGSFQTTPCPAVTPAEQKAIESDD